MRRHRKCFGPSNASMHMAHRGWPSVTCPRLSSQVLSCQATARSACLSGAGAITVDKGPVERGGVEVQSWQRVPSQLLNEHCQREKRPKPMYYTQSRCGRIWTHRRGCHKDAHPFFFPMASTLGP